MYGRFATQKPIVIYHGRMKQLSRAWVLALCSILLAGCGKTTPPVEERTFPILVSEAVEAHVPVYVDAIGNVFSPQTVQIRPQVSGIIQKAYISEGQTVRKGDPLYQIDPRPFYAALEKAKAALIKDEAALKFVEIKLQRNAELAKKDYIAKLTYEQYQSEVDAAKGQVLSDKADIETAQLNLEWAAPVSPLNGRIGLNRINPGNLVTAYEATAITDIRQMDPLEIRFNIAQKDFLEAQLEIKKEPLTFLVYLPQEPNNTRQGVVDFVDNHVDPANGTILLRGFITNNDEFLWPGEYVRVKLLSRTEQNAVLVPEEALQVGQEGTFVYVLNAETSRVDYRLVKKGQTYMGKIPILKGVKAGEKVVTRGMVNLRPNAKVFIVDNQSSDVKEGPKI